MEVVLFAFLRENWYTNFEKTFINILFERESVQATKKLETCIRLLERKPWLLINHSFQRDFCFALYYSQKYKKIGSMEHFVWFCIRIKRFQAKFNLNKYSVTKFAASQTHLNANLDVIIFAFLKGNGCD